jgi:hypothetical protein
METPKRHGTHAPIPITDLDAELSANHTKLATAAKILIGDAPQSGLFTEDTVAAMRGLGEDPVIAGLIRFALDLATVDHRLTPAELDAISGLAVRVLPIEDLFEVGDEGGQLTPGVGLDATLVGLYAVNRIRPVNIPFLEGLAVISNADDVKHLIPVRILTSGAAFVERETLSA